jgi:lipoyl(octanoyl) transferase
VSRIERSLIDLLASYGVTANAKPDAPGVYVDGAKIASLGLRIRNGRSFHGLALNVDMDLQPFQRINPCGYAGMAMTQLADQVAGAIDISEVGARLRELLVKHLDYAQQQTLAGVIDG